MQRDSLNHVPKLLVYSTGQAAKICGVSQQTIIRLFDSGWLRGFCVPGSKFRRIPRESLFTYMIANGIPTDGLGELTEAERAQVAAKVMGTVKLALPNRLEGVSLAVLEESA